MSTHLFTDGKQQQQQQQSVTAVEAALDDDRMLSPVNENPPNLPAPAPQPRRARKKLPLRLRMHRFFGSLPFIVTALYGIFLAVVAAIIWSVTKTQMREAYKDTVMRLHSVKGSMVHRSIDFAANNVHATSITAAGLYADSKAVVESDSTLTMLCATLAMSDKMYDMRSLALGNLDIPQFAGCYHGDPEDATLDVLSVIMTDNDRFFGMYYVNETTFERFDPPRVKTYFDSTISAALVMRQYESGDPFFGILQQFMNGTVSDVPHSMLWFYPVNRPTFIYFSYPVLMLGSTPLNIVERNRSDYVQVRISGTCLLTRLGESNAHNTAHVMLLANATLLSGDPIVMADTWGQAPVHNEPPIFGTDTKAVYLYVSQINESLMREAVKHVDFAAMQESGYSKTVYFRYNNAQAFVTAQMYTNKFGLQVPVVFATSTDEITGPVLISINVCDAMLWVAVVLMTALCYFAIDRYLARPLRRLTAAMLASVQRGARQPVRADPCDVLQLTETRELTRAYNTAMAQLRAVDEFVPPGMRANPLIASTALDSQNSGDGLRCQYITMLTVRIRSLTGSNSAPSAVPAARATACEETAENDDDNNNEVEMASKSHGPFAARNDLAAFLTAVLGFSVEYSGIVQHITPDTCVLYFGAAVKKATAEGLIPPADPSADSLASGQNKSLLRKVQRLVAEDARSALAFGFALLHWVDTCGGPAMPDVRVMVDTGAFSCGHYKAAGSEQTVAVGFGRDVYRHLGHIPARIGVRVAMTEETASVVRPGNTSGGVMISIRQLPVEAMRVGRVGLNANVVILYEALPGEAAGNHAWMRYAECCSNGFSLMLKGAYAAALANLKEVVDIAELEPGLVPSRFKREAPRYTGAARGAVSTQVERLMKECERRLATHWTQGFYRTPVRPLGIDVVLGDVTRDHQRDAQRKSGCPPKPTPPPHKGLGHVDKRRGRYGLTVKNPQAPTTSLRIAGRLPGTALRTTYSGPPASMQDNWGQTWQLGKVPHAQLSREVHDRRLPALNSNGILGVTRFYLYREVPAIVADALVTVGDGVLSDTARHSVPFWLPSPLQREAVHKLFGPCLRLRHANVLACLGYTIAYEGGVCVVYEHFNGVPVHQLRSLFPGDRCCAVLTRLGCSILKGLTFLHLNGIVHGALRPDSILVASDGLCRLKGYFTNYGLAHRVFCIPRSCYVSPEVAAGKPPTPASDVFGYGLVMLELVTQRSPWMWAPVADGSDVQPTEEALAALMAAGGEAFSALVAQRRVMPAVERLDGLPSSGAFSASSAYVIRRCLEWDARDRISMKEALNGTIKAGKVKRSRLAKRHALLHFGDSDDDDDEDDEDDGTRRTNDDALIQIL